MVPSFFLQLDTIWYYLSRDSLPDPVKMLQQILEGLDHLHSLKIGKLIAVKHHVGHVFLFSIIIFDSKLQHLHAQYKPWLHVILSSS